MSQRDTAKRGPGDVSRRELLAGSAVLLGGAAAGPVAAAPKNDRLKPQFRRVYLQK